MGECDEPPTWDLSSLVESEDADRVKRSMDECLEEAEIYQEKYKGRIQDLSPSEIYNLFRELDNIYMTWYHFSNYVWMRQSQNGEDATANEFLDYLSKIESKFKSKLVFFEIEIAQTLLDRPEIVQDPQVREYRHALEKAREKGKYLLSENDEKLINEKDRHGIDRWFQLHEELISRRKHHVTIKGEEKTITGAAQFISMLEGGADRNTRKEITEAFYEAISIDRIVNATALKCVFGDHLDQVKRRKYPSILTQSLLDNDISESTLDALIASMKNRIPLIRRFLKLRAKALGLTKLTGYDMDRYSIAPITEDHSNVSWSEARRLVIDAYTAFSKEAGEFIADLFRNKRIDASIRPAKSARVFCADFPSLRTAYVSVGYSGTLLSVAALAHECGHGLQSYFSSENHIWINQHPGSCLAETGSGFGELLLADKLLQESKGDTTKLAALDKVLCSLYVSVFNILHTYLFELSVFTSLENDEVLDAEKLDELWVNARTEVFGDSIEWLSGMEQRWMIPPHFYVPNYRFYNYPYAFGLLLVFVLYRLYKEEGVSFVPKMKQILSAGCSESPKTLLAEIGLDLTDPNFWEIGFKQAEMYLDEFEQLVKRMT